MTDHHLADAMLRRRRRFSLIWLVPILCGAIAVYLVITTLADRGPLITITFKTGDGITAQQTQVTHKAVSLGLVEQVRLSDDLTHVQVKVRMNHQGARILTDHARFWVVRPRLSTGNISGLETLVSGAYIEVDPGLPGGAPELEFTGLEEPPGMRSDEPGHTYTLRSQRLGSLGPGAPVFYRDVTVGEVLGYDLGDGLGPVTLKVFVRSPFDKFVRQNTRFWNASGLSVVLGPQGVHLEVESLAALLSGGIAFETPHKDGLAPLSTGDQKFALYGSKGAAEAAGFRTKIPMVSYFSSSVSGLVAGSPVVVYGIQVGEVTSVELLMDAPKGQLRVRVHYEIEPERVFGNTAPEGANDPKVVTAALVNQGLRAVLESSNFITGQKRVSLEYVPGAKPEAMTEEGNVLVIPSQGGGLDAITSSLSDIAIKLDKIPFEEIGKNLNETLASANRVVSSEDLRESLKTLSATLKDVQGLVRHTDAGLQPVLQRLPKMSADLQQAVARAAAALGEGGYGGNSDFQRGVSRLLDQVNEAARSIRLLADFLDRHPEALVRGRTGSAGEK